MKIIATWDNPHGKQECVWIIQINSKQNDDATGIFVAADGRFRECNLSEFFDVEIKED